MSELRDRARAEMAGDALSEQRFGYWTWTFDLFLVEAKEYWALNAAPPPAAPKPAPEGVLNQYE
jgi:hypothetical protein